MTRSKVSLLSALTFVLALAAIPLKASDPVGIYCIVDKVVLAPNETEPTSVQIWGAFSFAVPRLSNGTQPKPAGSFGEERLANVYTAVQKGYLYYTCPKGKDSTCLNEWADLRSVAGKGEVIGFGFRYEAPGRVRKATEKPESPDLYPTNIGIVRMGKAMISPDLLAALKAAGSK
jgi:hypothetical protein